MKTPNLLLLIVLLLPSGYVLSGGGSLEINQVCIETGCFPGDEAGFPVQINVPGKYILTSGLTVDDPYTHAISVSADNVRIDLNGVTIQGPNTCDLDAGTCSPAGGGRGIMLVDFNARKGIHVVNGQIDGFGNYCMEVGVSGLAADLTLSNCFAGISAGRGAVVERVRAYNNRYGIDMTGEAMIRDSSSMDNIIGSSLNRVGSVIS